LDMVLFRILATLESFYIRPMKMSRDR